MANTSIIRVRGIAPHLSQVTDENLQMHIDDAILELKQHKYNLDEEEKLQRYLAAHFASLGNPQAKSEEIDDMKIDYGNINSTDDKDLDRTPFGQEARRMLRRGRGPSFLVIS